MRTTRGAIILKISFESKIEELGPEKSRWRFAWDHGLHLSFPWFKKVYLTIDTETSTDALPNAMGKFPGWSSKLWDKPGGISFSLGKIGGNQALGFASREVKRRRINLSLHFKTPHS